MGISQQKPERDSITVKIPTCPSCRGHRGHGDVGVRSLKHASRQREHHLGFASGGLLALQACRAAGHIRAYVLAHLGPEEALKYARVCGTDTCVSCRGIIMP